MGKTLIQLRVSDEFKKELDQIFDGLGMTTQSGILLFLKQVSYHKGIPFEIKLPNPEKEEKKLEPKKI